MSLDEGLRGEPPFYWQADLVADIRIPVLRPKLPGFESIEPYLRRIDANRWYSNSGPLVREFEARLAARLDAEPGCVTTVANGTIGLVLALQALGLRTGTLCMVPAWTFAATAHAIQRAGLTPWIVDVDRESWALDAATAESLIANAPAPVSAIVPVAPFGHPLDIRSWETFRERTGVAVVLDAAAAFDTIEGSSLPTVVSLHATKVLGTGEGGYVFCRDPQIIKEVQQRANFGFWGSREARAPGLNGKVSEYAAAIGLAALDAWPSTRDDFMRVAAGYRSGLAGRNDVFLQDGLGASWVASTISIAAPAIGAAAIARALADEKIGSRRWWGGGLHRHTAFTDLPRTTTENTDCLVESVIGLPCWPDLPDADIARICEIAAIARS
jgi:dTDP-4-amino-4,6-dideoxygalactose transaminase